MPPRLLISTKLRGPTDTGQWVARERLLGDLGERHRARRCRVAAHPSLAKAMAAKRRAGFALRTLLGDEALRAYLVEVTRGLRASFAGLPLAVRVPSPWRWPALAHAQAHGPGAGVTVGEDEADAAAVALADFLRAFGDCGLDALLLDEPEAGGPTSESALELYRPVLNVGGFYRDVGLGCGAGAPDLGGGGGLGFVIAPRAVASVTGGLALPASFWSGDPPSSRRSGDFFYVEIPRDAQPESVLERLSSLRGR